MMQMKKTCIIRNIALDDVDEKTCIIKTLHLMMQMKNMYYKNSSPVNEDEKISIIKNITLDDVDEKSMF